MQVLILALFYLVRMPFSNPARALNLDNQIGKILENYQADFIFTQTSRIDDLAVLETPEAVIKNGYFYSKKL